MLTFKDKSTRNRTFKAHERAIHQAILEIVNRRTGASVQEICRIAKVSRPTFYQHYDNSDSSLRCYEQEIVDEFKQVFAPVTKKSVGFAKLLAFASSHRSYLSRALRNNDFYTLARLVDVMRALTVPAFSDERAYEVYRMEVCAIVQAWVLQERCSRQKFDGYIKKLQRVRLMRWVEE